MAVNPVSLCADLQAWHSAGLSFLYFPEVDATGLMKAPAGGRVADNSESPSGQHNSPFKPSNVAQQSPVRNSEKNSANAGFSRPEADERLSDAPATSNMDSAKQLADKVRGTNASQISPGKNGNALPEHWKLLLNKVRPAPVIWTYLELGEDLMIKGDPSRSAMLKELIASLGLQKGTSSFLPLTLPDGAHDGAEAWCFQACLNHLKGRIIVVLGMEALLSLIHI